MRFKITDADIDSAPWRAELDNPHSGALATFEGRVRNHNQGRAVGALHYACYQEGSFYRKHVDSFVNDKSRQYSLIVYLNPDWTEADGGQLKLYIEDETVEILPESGRAVCFPSHLIPHEVANSHKRRLSLTGWLKK